MNNKRWLVEGFCPTDGYHCLMPVEYEAEVEEGVIQRYHKSRMGCRHALRGECQKESECPFYKNSPEQLEKNAAWHD